MKFGPVPVADAEGAILAHSLRLARGERLRKGLTLDPVHLEALRAAGIAVVTVARLDPGDVHEDVAAQELAEALVDGAEGLDLSRPFTGRVNLRAVRPGVVQLDTGKINAANAIDPMITVATVPQFHQIEPDGLAATVKIISYAVPRGALVEVTRLARGSLTLAQSVCRTASLIITETPGGLGQTGAKAVLTRLDRLEIALAEAPVRCPHDEAALADEIASATGEIILVLTGSATSDKCDTAPAALRRAGGRVERFGMPVDPGNLLFLGELSGRPVIGLPNSARSPVLHGVDWVLARVVCGVPVTSADIAGMGVGGLLKEIPTRPMPRREKK